MHQYTGADHCPQTITKDAEAMREEWEKQQLMRKLKEIEEDNRKLQELLSADSSHVESVRIPSCVLLHASLTLHSRQMTRSWAAWAW